MLAHSALPLLLTVHRFGAAALLDADAAEALCADGALWAAVAADGQLGASGCLPGGDALAPQALMQLLAAAGQAGVAQNRALEAHLKGAASLALRPLAA